MDSTPGVGPQTSASQDPCRLRQGLSRTGAYTCLTQGLLARTLRTHARPHARSPRSAHALLSTSPLASAPPPPRRVADGLLGAARHLSCQTRNGHGGFSWSARHTRASIPTITYLPTYVCPALSYTYVIALSVHELHHAAHVGRLRSHPRRTSCPSPEGPRLWGMPWPLMPSSPFIQT